MRRIPFRWFLPTFHLAMDATLVIMQIFQIQAELHREKRHGKTQIEDCCITSVAFPQESGTVEFDPKYIWHPPSPSLTLIRIGTVPAVLLADLAIPRADFQRITWRSLERWWLITFGLLAALFWFAVGRSADRGELAIYKWCFAFVIIRIIALSLVASPIWRAGAILQVLFWLGATICITASGLWTLIRKIRTVPQPVSKKPSSGELP